MTRLKSYTEGTWHEASKDTQDIFSAVTGEKIFEVGSHGLNFKAALDYGKKIGGPQLRKLNFHERGLLLKQLAKYLNDRKDELYKLSPLSGATKADSWLDIDGGIGTLFVYASKSKREFPAESFYIDGEAEKISKNGTFTGRHICVPLEGVAVHINAFNFPCWGMLEKLAPTFLAGMPALVKPASNTAYLAEKLVSLIVESKILPEGALQLVSGSLGDTFNYLSCQDVVTFTGSASTGQKLKQHPSIMQNSVRFNMEADSLNFCILGPDAKPGTEEFNLFIKEVAKEMTVKAVQKCTAIRRTLVPSGVVSDVLEALKKRLAGVVIGDPALEDVRMGPLVGKDQQQEVWARLGELMKASELVCGGGQDFAIKGGSKEKGAFFPSTLLYCKEAFKRSEPHQIEAFGPVNTVMSYNNTEEVIELAKLGRGSLVGSVFSADDKFAKDVVLGVASHHGRIVLLNKDSAAESTGHGSPLPHLVHGGPGRAGGGEEMGGHRAVLHYMQRTAIQGSPTTLSKIGNQFIKGALQKRDQLHPFRKYFEELEIGETLITHRRTITESDVVSFAGISGDFFYAHMDDVAARESIFEKRVAHGYFVIAAAAGLFVDPAPGPVLANYGLEGLRFIKPVYIGDTIHVRLTCKQKTSKENIEGVIPQGVVAWDVEVINQNEEAVAVYCILTLVRKK